MKAFFSHVHWKHDLDMGLTVTKIIIMMAMFAVVAFPQHATWMGLVANMIWLWRT